MENKILYICLGISLFTSIFLGIYITKCEPVCERIHLDVIDRSIDYISDEQMAIDIAEACLGLDENWELQKNPIFDVKVIYSEESYEWIVVFLPRDLEKVEKRIIGIRRDYGNITDYTWSQ